MDAASKEFLRLYSLLLENGASLDSLSLENRDLEKEKSILQNKDSYSAYLYAKNVIKHRFPEAEEFIKENPKIAYDYARDIIKDRWPEAEELIKKEPSLIYFYARSIIKGRWLEAEKIIKKDSYWAYWYAVDVINGRWPEAEGYIKKSNYSWNKYLELICKKCNGDGIVDTGIGGADEECDKCNGGGFDPSKI